MEQKWQKRNDYILIGVIICVMLGCIVAPFFLRESGGIVRIMVDGQIQQEFSLHESIDGSITGADGKSVHYRCDGGSVDVIEAACPDQLCVNQKAISKTGESIICLPGKIVIEIYGADQQAFDSITH